MNQNALKWILSYAKDLTAKPHLLLPRPGLGRMVVFIFSSEPIIERKPICIEEPSALPFRLITISGVPGTPTFLEGAEGTEKGFLALRYQVLH